MAAATGCLLLGGCGGGGDNVDNYDTLSKYKSVDAPEGKVGCIKTAAGGISCNWEKYNRENGLPENP